MLKFARSSSVCYRWIEDSDPVLFNEIKKLVDEGRWELVGGWVEQSDTIITPAESLIRQAEHGNRYFLEKFGRTANIAYDNIVPLYRQRHRRLFNHFHTLQKFCFGHGHSGTHGNEFFPVRHFHRRRQNTHGA